MEERTKHFVELFSVGTAISFFAAAFVQIIIFATWGLDFTALASVEDVLMSGIKMLVIVGTATVFLVLFTVSGHIFDTEKSREIKIFTMKRAISSIAALSIFLTVFYAISSVDNIRTGARILAALCAFFTLPVGMFTAFIMTSKVKLSEVMNYSPKALWFFFGLDMFVAVGIMFIVLLFGYPGIGLEPVSVLPERCHKNYEILWIGSRTIVVECGNEINAVLSESTFILRADAR